MHVVPPILAALGLLLAWRRHRPVARVLGLVLLAYPVAYGLTHVEARYRLPLEPVLLVSAALLIAGPKERPDLT